MKNVNELVIKNLQKKTATTFKKASDTVPFIPGKHFEMLLREDSHDLPSWLKNDVPREQQSRHFVPLRAGNYTFSIQASARHSSVPKKTLDDPFQYKEFEVYITKVNPNLADYPGSYLRDDLGEPITLSSNAIQDLLEEAAQFSPQAAGDAHDELARAKDLLEDALGKVSGRGDSDRLTRVIGTCVHLLEEALKLT